MNCKMIRRKCERELPAWIFKEMLVLSRSSRSMNHLVDLFTRDWHAVGTGAPFYSEQFINGNLAEMKRYIEEQNILNHLTEKFMDFVPQETGTQLDWTVEFYGRRQIGQFIYRLRQVSYEVNAWYLEMQRMMEQYIQEEE